MKRSSRKKKKVASSSRRRTTSTRSSTHSWTVVEAKLGSSWSSWEKPQWSGRIEGISRLNIRDNCEEKIDRRSRYYPWIRSYRMKSIAWTIREIFKILNQYASQPVCFSHLIQFLVECLAVLKECRAAEKGRQAFGTRIVFRERFLQIQQRLLQHLIHRSWTHGVLKYQNQLIHSSQDGKREPNTSSRSEMPVWTVSQKFSHPKWGSFFKELWGRPTTTAAFWSPLWSSLHQQPLLAGR